MFAKAVALAGLVSATSAASMNLTAALASNPNLSNLTTYIQLFPSLEASLSAATNVTLLAPDNNAFAKLLNSSAGSAFSANDTALIESFFSYHILNGTYYSSNITSKPTFIGTNLLRSSNFTDLQDGAVVEAIKVGNETQFYSGLLGSSTVTQANNNFTGGTIHVVDTFLTLPQNISASLVELNETAAAGALEMAGAGSGALPANLTAFIPSNAAFQAVGSMFANISIQELGGILAYHLVPDVVAYSTDLTNMTLTSSTNQTLKITVENGTVFVNSAKVLVPNIIVQEGVVHIIDEVLNPQNTTATPNASKTAVAFAGASSEAKVPFTSGIPAPTSVPAAATASGGAAGAASATQGGASSTSSKGLAARPLQTGAMGAAALFGGAVAIMAV